MGEELNEFDGAIKAKRSTMAALLSLALFAISVTFVLDGPLRAVTILAAAAALVAVFRGVPEALVEYAGRKRGATYMKSMSIIIPIAMVLLSAYVYLLLSKIRASDLVSDFPLGLTLAFVIIVGVVNLGALALNVFLSN